MATKSIGDLELWLPAMTDVLDDTIETHLVENFNKIDTGHTTHLAESMSEGFYSTRDATLTGVQNISLVGNRKPKDFIIHANVDNSTKESLFFGGLAKYFILGTGWRSAVTYNIVIADSTVNYTRGVISNIQNGSFDIVWSHIGTGGTGNISIAIKVLYHD